MLHFLVFFYYAFRIFVVVVGFQGWGGRETEETDAHIPIHVVSLMSYSQKNYCSLFFK